MSVTTNKLSALALCIAFLFSACSKKTTKIEQPPPDPEISAEEVVDRSAVDFTPSDEDLFTTVDLDAAMKDIFVPVYFDYDQYSLKAEAIEKLERIAVFLSENETMRFLIEGHADERGTHEYNIGLGENRARTIREYLTTYGIPSVQLEFTSYGRERPATPNCPDEQCHSRNRRVEWAKLAR